MSEAAERGEGAGEFLADVLAGLSLPQKTLPCKYFYDERGSRLFDAICGLDEYYPTRAELEILAADAGAMAAAIGPGRALIELGSGSGLKTRRLLAALREPAAYAPVDVAREHLLAASAAIAAELPGLRVTPICADFTRPLALPPGLPARRVVYFPGSTIGNFTAEEAGALLRRIAAIPGCEGALIGIDLQKSVEVLEAAYNDRRGVTAEFNRNLLVRIDAELGGDFVPERFEHRARYDGAAARIEMRLVSAVAQVVHVGGRRFAFAAGESILTELSHKYTVEGFAAMAEAAGLRLSRCWTDAGRRFAVVWLTREG